MSEDETFLSRWSQRKREAAKSEIVSVTPDKPVSVAAVESEAAPIEADDAIDLSTLPKLEELTETSDITAFLKKGVPESLRNAALRKSWALDPAIRNYVNPALEYAYDWNTPGGVPGTSELAVGTDVMRVVSQIMGTGDSVSDSKNSPPVEAKGRDKPSEPARDDAASQMIGTESEMSALRVSQVSPSPVEIRDQSKIETPDTPATAPQHPARRHGSATPRV